MSTSNKINAFKKHTFVYSPSQQDVDAYIKFKSGENKQRTYMKDYKALHHIDGLSDNSILVYEAIRNLVGMFVLQQKYKDSYKKQKLGSVGTTRNSPKDNRVVGTTMVITNAMLQEWIGDKSHNTIKSSLEQLESMGFIKCATDGTKKSGRKITLLRDMEEYQPEEIEAIEAYMNSMTDVCGVSSEIILTEDENSSENDSESVDVIAEVVEKSTKKSEKKSSKKSNGSNKKSEAKDNVKDNVKDGSVDSEELDDDFDF